MAGAALLNYQWELGDVVFGVDRPIGHEADATPATYSWRTQDALIPGRDARTFGRDLIEPGTWSFKLFTDQVNERTALAELEQLGDTWRGDEVRSTPGNVMPLRYRLADRTRRVYGRPRRFDYTMDNRFMGGYIPITADFVLSSELYFDDAESSVTIGMKEPVSGGFSTPVRAPVRVSKSTGMVPYTFAVGGLKAAPMAVDFHGPLQSTFLLIDGQYYIQLTDSIPNGVIVTVDARPWVNAVYRNDGGGVAGLLSPRSRMPKMVLMPGTHVATLGGISSTGTGKAVIRWRSAYPTV